MNNEQLNKVIESEYRRLGYNLGWSLIYGPYETMWHPRYPVAFFGLNPGGAQFEKPQLSNEEGSSYICEEWGMDKGRAPLQIQVQNLFESLAKALGKGITGNELLHGSMSANLVPFRSATWRALPRHAEALDFSKSLWRDRIASVPCNLYITMSKVSFNSILQLLKKEVGFEPMGVGVTEPVGWGKAHYEIQDFTSKFGPIAVIRLPHLSRYKIFSSGNCESAIEKIASKASEALAAWQPDRFGS